MCDTVIAKKPWSLEYVPDAHKAQEMCERAIEKTTRVLEYILDKYKSKEI